MFWRLCFYATISLWRKSQVQQASAHEHELHQALGTGCFASTFSKRTLDNECGYTKCCDVWKIGEETTVGEDDRLKLPLNLPAAQPHQCGSKNVQDKHPVAGEHPQLFTEPVTQLWAIWLHRCKKPRGLLRYTEMRINKNVRCGEPTFPSGGSTRGPRGLPTMTPFFVGIVTGVIIDHHNRYCRWMKDNPKHFQSTWVGCDWLCIVSIRPWRNDNSEMCELQELLDPAPLEGHQQNFCRIAASQRWPGQINNIGKQGEEEAQKMMRKKPEQKHVCIFFGSHLVTWWMVSEAVLLGQCPDWVEETGGVIFHRFWWVKKSSTNRGEKWELDVWCGEFQVLMAGSLHWTETNVEDLRF